MSNGWAILTGASAGIGAALAPRLAAEGYDVLLVARRADRLEALAAEIGAEHPDRKVEVAAIDLMGDDALAQILERVPEPAVLINNAGFGVFGPAHENEVEPQARMVRLNCESLTRLTLGVLPGMVARKAGVILNVGSIAGLQPVPFFSVYGATKAYVQSFSEALDEELSGTGVRVVVVCPGPVPTEFQGRAGTPDAREVGWLERFGPDDIARICVQHLRRPRRVVIPAAVHRVTYWAQRLVPRSTVVGIAARKMRKRHR